MHRLVIMVIYCDDGKLMSYKQKLIDDIRPYADTLHIVCNGTILEDGYDFLAGRADTVMIRENMGYDAGAYKDVLMKMDLQKYDELLLMNDTFFGFFYFLTDFFKKVRESKEIDFWGITKHLRGVREDGMEIPEHIQSYFLLIKSKMLHGEAFRRFWENMSYPASVDEAIIKFELSFTSYFQGKGFVGKAAYCDLEKLQIEDGKNPYMEKPYELIKDQECPVLKIKVLDRPFAEVWQIMRYLAEHTDYDISMIREAIDKRCRGNSIEFAKTQKLEEFYDSRNKVYLYGHGKIAANMAAFFEYRGWKYEGFLVTDKGKEEEAVKVYREVSLEDQDGIVLALGRRAFGEVYPIVKKDLQPQQIFKLYGGETQTFKEEKRPAKGARL